MSNFSATLDELMERATKGPWEVLPCSNGGKLLVRGDRMNKSTQMMPEADPEFIAFLANHAPAIRDLVVAAEKVKEWNKKYPSSRIYNESSIRRIAAEMDAINAELSEALAKLEEA